MAVVGGRGGAPGWRGHLPHRLRHLRRDVPGVGHPAGIGWRRGQRRRQGHHRRRQVGLGIALAAADDVLHLLLRLPRPGRTRRSGGAHQVAGGQRRHRHARLVALAAQRHAVAADLAAQQQALGLRRRHQHGHAVIALVVAPHVAGARHLLGARHLRGVYVLELLAGGDDLQVLHEHGHALPLGLRDLHARRRLDPGDQEDVDTMAGLERLRDRVDVVDLDGHRARTLGQDAGNVLDLRSLQVGHAQRAAAQHVARQALAADAVELGHRHGVGVDQVGVDLARDEQAQVHRGAGLRVGTRHHHGHLRSLGLGRAGQHLLPQPRLALPQVEVGEIGDAGGQQRGAQQQYPGALEEGGAVGHGHGPFWGATEMA